MKISPILDHIDNGHMAFRGLVSVDTFKAHVSNDLIGAAVIATE